MARGGEFVGECADTHAGSLGHLALVAVFAIGEEQDGLVLLGEMREGALEVDNANNARVALAGAALAPSLALVFGDLAGPHGGAVFGPLA